MTWENFTREEFACTHCGANEIQDSTIAICQDVRTECGFPLPVTSGYRCPEHPAERKKKATGTHTEGTATDFGVSGWKAKEVVKALSNHPKVTGIGVKQRGKRRFIHFDTADEWLARPRPHIWSY